MNTLDVLNDAMLSLVKGRKKAKSKNLKKREFKLTPKVINSKLCLGFYENEEFVVVSQFMSEFGRQFILINNFDRWCQKGKILDTKTEVYLNMGKYQLSPFFRYKEEDIEFSRLNNVDLID